ncbi:putative AC9 transposase [Ilyonectria robusta]
MQEKIGSPTRISAEENSANELLESMGYKPELQRDRSTLQVAFMAFVLASVPYGLATGLNWPVVGGGPVNIIWGWVAVSLVVMCVAASLGEITSIYPTAGADTDYKTAAVFWTFTGVTAMIITILVLAKHGRRDAKYVFTHFETDSGWPDGWSFCVGLLQAGYATSSTGMITAITAWCEEVRQPSIQVPKAMVATVFINTFAGLLFLVPLVFVMPDIKWLISVSGGQPVPSIFKSAVGVGCTTASSRCTWAFARDGAIPGTKWWMRIDQKLGVPLNAMMFCMVIEILWGLLYFGSSAAYNAFSGVGVISLNTAYVAPVAMSLFTGRKRIKTGRFYLGHLGTFCNVAAIDRQYPDKNEPLAAGRKRKTKGTVLYVCRLCPKWSHGHRATAVQHIKNRHAAQLRPPPPPSPISSNQRSLPALFASIPTPDSLRQVFNRQAYNEAVIGLLTRRRAPFSAVEWNELKDLALACNPTIGDQLIMSRRQAMRHIAENHTSPHRHALLAVCAQWVDQDYQLQKALLGLPECRDNHSGERQADLIMSILETFGIISKPGYHTGDNATSNDTYLESIARRLKENLNALTTRRRRGRRRLSRSDVDEDYLGIEGIPALRKLHGLAVWIRCSSLNSQLWDDEVGLRLGIDNETRWSSWYHVLDKLFKKKAQIVQFMHEHEQILGDNRLTAADWDLLQKAYLFLQPFDGATLCAEGNKASLLQSLFLMDCLLSHYKNEKRHYSVPETCDERMLHAIDMGWFIKNKYYTMTDDVPVYSAALLLDPSKRDAYIKQNCPDEWYDNAIGGAQAIWEEEYNIELPTKPPAAPSAVADFVEHESNKLAQLARSMKVKTAVLRSEDDFMTFITAQPIEINSTPLQWWCASEQRRRYPRLSCMAIAILSISPESSKPERAFSGARRTCSWDRLRIKCANIERVECIGSWLREGHILPTSRGGFGLPMMFSALKDDLTDSDEDLEDREDID